MTTVGSVLCSLAVAILAVLGAACSRSEEPAIQVIAGPDGAQRSRFTPESAYAEYVELPGGATELRVTLASYATSCEDFVAPASDDQFLVVVVVVTPPDEPLRERTYSWLGHRAHGGTANSPDKPYASPNVRIGPKAYRIPPGGFLRLTGLDLRPTKSVKGTLEFEFSGDEARPATAIQGAFDAELCRLVRRD